MIRSVILVAQNFQDEEFAYPYYRMLEEGWAVDVASPKGIDVYGKYGVPARVNRSTAELFACDYDAVIIPGGFESPDRLRMQEEVLQFVSAMWELDKCVAAICHGPWVLISADIMRGVSATCYPSLKDDLMNAGARYIDHLPVVIDRNLITSDHYRNNGPFMKAVIAWCSHPSVREEYMAAHA